MKVNKIFLSVVIPAYNEEENFRRRSLDEVVDYLNRQSFFWEVLLVDDESNDGTAKSLNDFAKKHPGWEYLRIKHSGKLAAIKAGIEKARGEIVLFCDFDQSTAIGQFDKFLVEFKKGTDIVIGDRWAKTSKRLNDTWLSWWRSLVFAQLAKFTVGGGVNDTQCGFKAFKRGLAVKLFSGLKVNQVAPRKQPFMGAFDVEVLLLAKKMDAKITSVPVTWRRIKSERLTFSEPFIMFWSLVKLKCGC